MTTALPTRSFQRMRIQRTRNARRVTLVHMNAQELRAQQAPLKERYKEQPESALVTLHASGRLGENVTVLVKAWNGEVTAGLHPATGGDGKDACSGDMLL